MSRFLQKSRALRWLKKFLIIFAAVILTTILLISAAVIFLPAAVSTQTAHQLIESQVSKVLARDARIKALDWSWKNGLVIQGFSIPDSPHYSENQIIYIDEIKVKPDIKKMIRRIACLEIEVSGLNVRIIKNPDASLNIDSLGKKPASGDLSPALPGEEKKEDEKKQDEKKDAKETPPAKSFALSIDIFARIRLSDINLSYDDRIKKERYAISDLEFTLDAPSVKTAPMTLALAADIKINDQNIPRSTLTANVKNLFDADGAFAINALTAALDADLPGIIARIRADMAASEIRADVQMDLARIASVFQPLIPAFPTPSDIGGTLSLNVKTNTDPNAPLAFDARLTGSALQVSGAVLDGKSIGPGNLNFNLQGTLDLKAEQLALASGDITLLENSHLHASGQIDHIKNDAKDVRLSISPLYLDVDELAAFARPFLPAMLVLTHPADRADISLHELTLSGQIPKGGMEVLINDLKISLPEFILKNQQTGDPALRMSGTQLELDELTARLLDFFPESASMKLSLGIDDLLSGDKQTGISVSGIRLDSLKAGAVHLLKTETSQLKIQGDFSLENHLQIGQILLPDLAKIAAISQSLWIQANLEPNGTFGASLDHFDVETPELSVLKKDIGPVQTGLKIHLALDKMDVKTLEPLQIDVKNLLARLDFEKALSLIVQAGAMDTGNKSFNADLKINSDLSALLEKISSNLIPEISGAGNLTIDAHAAGRRPRPEEIEKLKSRHFSDNLSFIDQARFYISLDAARFAIPQTNGPGIIIGRVDATPLLSYDLTGATGIGRINAQVKAGDITGLPGITPDAPVSVSFSLSGGHEFAKVLDLHPSVSLVPSDTKASIDIIINGLDQALSRSPMPAPPLWLADLSGGIKAHAFVPDCKKLKNMGVPGLSTIDLSGQIDAGLEVHLKANESLNSELFLRVQDMNLGLADTMKAESIRTHLEFSKAYRIVSAAQSQLLAAGSGLSDDVMDSPLASGLFSGNRNISNHIRQVHERMNPDPALSIEKADILGAPFPLVLGESIIMLNFKNGLPQLDYFQVNLLGGTANGSISLVPDPLEYGNQTNNLPKFHANTALNFSGINFAEIFPQAFSKDNLKEADLSGLLYADFPITDQLQDILENAEIRIEFTRIGARALERILYALDPYETNEAMAAQRRLLKAGFPKQIRLDIRDGFLSLKGDVVIKGVTIALPAIRRLNLAQIPGMARFQGRLSGLTPVLSILQKLSAEKIVINRQTNVVSFE